MTIEDLAFMEATGIPVEANAVEFGQWLKSCRVRKRLTLEQASQKLEIPVLALAAYESGEDITLSALMKMAQLYGIKKEILIEKVREFCGLSCC